MAAAGLLGTPIGGILMDRTLAKRRAAAGAWDGEGERDLLTYINAAVRARAEVESVLVGGERESA